jgi:hypothetical protein
VPPGGIYFQPPGLLAKQKVIAGVPLILGSSAVEVDGKLEATLDPSYWRLTRAARDRLPHVIEWGYQPGRGQDPNR